jgi:hypothetical protein
VEKCYKSDEWESKRKERIEQYREHYIEMAGKFQTRSFPSILIIEQLSQLMGLNLGFALSMYI